MTNSIHIDKGYIFNGVTVYSDIKNFTADDAKKYVDYIFNNVDPAVLTTNPLESVKVTETADGKAKVDYWLHGQKFERIRRITG